MIFFSFYQHKRQVHSYFPGYFNSIFNSMIDLQTLTNLGESFCTKHAQIKTDSMLKYVDFATGNLDSQSSVTC